MVDFSNKKLLSISIPTFERPSYLKILLDQISKEFLTLDHYDDLEILICDNSISSDTQDLVKSYYNLPIRYIKNKENIGSDLNIAQCFNLSDAKYVWIMGDDDVPVDGLLRDIMLQLSSSNFGAIFLNAYGYSKNFMCERPTNQKGWIKTKTAGAFLNYAGGQITLISSCIVNKSILSHINANDFIGGNLVQVHLFLHALCSNPNCLLFKGFGVACKRNNSGGYSYSEVFVINLGKILDSFGGCGISSEDISDFEKRILISHHATYIFKCLLGNSGAMDQLLVHFDERFGAFLAYKYLFRPILHARYPLNLVLCFIWLCVGRLATRGGLARGMGFIRSKIFCS